MTDIGVSMSRETLEHKKTDGPRSYGYCYWEMRVPEALQLSQKNFKLWVAQGGRWRGYFIIHEDHEDEVCFYSDSWHEVDGGPRTPFRGFTYKVPEVVA